MTNAKRGRGSRRGVYICAIAALGVALSGCGGNAASSSAAAAAQGPTSAQQPVPPPASTPPASPTSDQTPSGSGTPADAASSETSGDNPPTASIGSVMLNWMPPTENVDGTPLINLAGYHIHYGTASGKYTQTISVSNPGIATYVVSSLTPGTYYFSVAAVNAEGAESPLSAEVRATVN